MTDLFAFGSAVKDPTDADRYGSAGDMKKTQYMMQLLGQPTDPDTLKCLIVAAEKGVELESAVIDISGGAMDSDDYRAIDPLGCTPALQEANYRVTGDLAIISFIEGRGLGNRMPPRNAAVLAQQNFWADVARRDFDPLVRGLVQVALSDSPDATQVAEQRTAAAQLLDALDQQLHGREFIVGPYSYADVHWTAYVHLLNETGYNDLVARGGNVLAWFERIKSHRSCSGQNIVAYDLLPKLDDLRAQRLQDVVITDF